MGPLRVQERVLSPASPQPNRSAKLLIIQAINLHPLNLSAPSLSPSGCSNGGTSGHRRLIFFPLLFFLLSFILVFHCIYLPSKATGPMFWAPIFSFSYVFVWECEVFEMHLWKFVSGLAEVPLVQWAPPQTDSRLLSQLMEMSKSGEKNYLYRMKRKQICLSLNQTLIAKIPKQVCHLCQNIWGLKKATSTIYFISLKKKKKKSTVGDTSWWNWLGARNWNRAVRVFHVIFLGRSIFFFCCSRRTGTTEEPKLLCFEQGVSNHSKCKLIC